MFSVGKLVKQRGYRGYCGDETGWLYGEVVEMAPVLRVRWIGEYRNKTWKQWAKHIVCSEATYTLVPVSEDERVMLVIHFLL